jgi:hypothetical protein
VGGGGFALGRLGVVRARENGCHEPYESRGSRSVFGEGGGSSRGLLSSSGGSNISLNVFVSSNRNQTANHDVSLKPQDLVPSDYPPVVLTD